ncbi:SDR family oxidoreductase [Pseudomaricurvus alkylphenolicus]|uniref:SDR family oxidoreductase n=1 Tax=Pseudomaricurvus alkylphenolicus TaxID=1306991 RepID=UPI00141F8E3B|nr:SDR family oxidoreductase [Pseudomaricurvus alkylphenolicus]NIB40322.1 SDR family oxidoreductase [Pseudomaricurvus alkylphenolicus]
MSNVSYDYSDRVVFVTGGARGIGRAICEAFAASGAQVVTCARREPEEPFSSPKIAFHSIDIRDDKQTEAFLAKIAEQYGRLDVLVNNAGGSPLAPSETASVGFTQKVIALNLTAPLVLSSQAHRYLAKQRGASIINIASISDLRPSPGTSAYGAAKAGLVNASRSLAQEWGPEIRINSIICGMVATELTAEHYGSDESMQSIESTIGMKRFGKPGDVAQACLYLASDGAAYASGAALEVHGGGEIALSVQKS